MLTVGWSLRFCAVGVAVPDEGIATGGALLSDDPARAAEINIVLERTPKVNIPVPDVPRFVRAGFTLVPVRIRSYDLGLPPDLPYAWLTVTATSKLMVDADLEAAFYKDPKLMGSRLSQRYGAAVRQRLRPVAQLAVALTGLWLKEAVLLPWVEQERYWTSETDLEGFSVGSQGESLNVAELQQTHILSHLLDVIACMRRDAREVRLLTRAVVDFAQARAQLVFTPERMLGMVRCLETLCGLVQAASSPEYLAKAEDLRRALADSPPELRDFAEHLINRPPSAVTRFERLAESVDRPSREADVTLFRDLWNLRGSILHGARDPELTAVDDLRLARSADELASGYLEAVVAQFRAEAVRLGKIVLG